MDECQRLTQTLRSENARLKDRILAVQGQNRDYAERASDDARRLATQDDAIERLEHSVQAYQDTIARLEAAYKKFASNLGSPELSKDEPRGRAQPSEMSRSFAPAPSRQTKATASLHSDDAPR
jgi:chromosome segregation ATPase